MRSCRHSSFTFFLISDAKVRKKNKVHKFVDHKLVNFNIILEIKISISTPRWLAPSPGIASEISGRESSTIWSCRTAASAPENHHYPIACSRSRRSNACIHARYRQKNACSLLRRQTSSCSSSDGQKPHENISIFRERGADMSIGFDRYEEKEVLVEK